MSAKVNPLENVRLEPDARNLVSVEKKELEHLKCKKKKKKHL